MFKVTTAKSSTPKAQMCQVCRVKPQYYDKGRGKLHPFCTKTCASKVPKAATAVCDYCQQHPKSGPHPYCSKTCAAAAKLKKSETCSLTDCTNRATRYPDGSYWNYCSTSHEELALRGCIYCRDVPYIGDYFPLCAACDSYLVGHGPFILPVPQDHTTYWAVRDQFEAAWAHPTKSPQIRMVYRIIPAPSVFGITIGHTEVYWRRKGNSPRRESILGSFNMAHANTGAWQRYGPGIYTSTKSSKSNDYVKNKNKSPWKAMLLNNVLAGFEYTTLLNKPELKGPPQGYDSVYGKPGKDLNYDELVVYTDHAIRPAYLVMYE